ncbi:MAG TPA: hypothetical protein VN604_02440 [Nitrospirota bacterium]|nr:hypothetical protein [Nitrospirota bacterium]
MGYPSQIRISLVIIILFQVFVLPVMADDTLNKYMADLKKKPDALELRAKIISHVQSMKSAPPVPEEAVRALTRGKVILNMAKDKQGYEKAIPELQEVITAAPWIAEAYENLAVAQEKSGYYADAIQNLQFLLLVDPKAKNAKDVKKKIFELEVYAEQAGQTVVPAPGKLPKSAAGKKPETGGASKATENKYDPDLYIGSWYMVQEGRKGEDAMIHAFTLQKNTKGDLVAMPPRRVTGSIGSVSKFHIDGQNLELQITWKSSSIPGYWKSEDFDLVLSPDGKTLKGKYEQKSSGSRGDITDTKEFTKQ